MDHVALVLPIRPGKAEEVRAFMQELSGPRMAEFDRSERALGVGKELWFLSSMPGGEALVGYLEAEDFNKVLTQFGPSEEPIDVWFKERVLDLTGVDLQNLPPDFRPPELLLHYDAGVAR